MKKISFEYDGKKVESAWDNILENKEWNYDKFSSTDIKTINPDLFDKINTLYLEKLNEFIENDKELKRKKEIEEQIANSSLTEKIQSLLPEKFSCSIHKNDERNTENVWDLHYRDENFATIVYLKYIPIVYAGRPYHRSMQENKTPWIVTQSFYDSTSKFRYKTLEKAVETAKVQLEQSMRVIKQEFNGKEEFKRLTSRIFSCVSEEDFQLKYCADINNIGIETTSEFDRKTNYRLEVQFSKELSVKEINMKFLGYDKNNTFSLDKFNGILLSCLKELEIE